ncbi:hypothetical protein Ancab_001047 [Ancistrocladus abbreviatus]
MMAQIIPFSQAGLRDENSATFQVEDDPEAAASTFFVQQILDPPADPTKSNLNSNDTMVKNLKHLYMENSRSDGPSINSTDLKRKKKGTEGRAHSKKNKTNKSFVPTHDDLQVQHAFFYPQYQALSSSYCNKVCLIWMVVQVNSSPFRRAISTPKFFFDVNSCKALVIPWSTHVS